MGQLAVSLGHTLEPPVPSLFTFHHRVRVVEKLAGFQSSRSRCQLQERNCMSGGGADDTLGPERPGILRLSAWGARQLHELDYRFTLLVNWLPDLKAEGVAAELESRRKTQPARFRVNTPIRPLTARLWEQLVLAAGILPDTAGRRFRELHNTSSFNN